MIRFSKYISVILFFTTVFCCTNKARKKTEASDRSNSNEVNYFYSNGKKVEFTVLENKKAVRLTPEMTAVAFDAGNTLPIDTGFNFSNDIEVLDIGERNKIQDTLFRKISDASSNLINVIQVKATEANLIVTNRFIAKFKPQVSDREIDSIARVSGCRVIERSTVRKGRVVFECSTGTLRSANNLYESGKVEYAHPDFIAEIDLRAPYYPNDSLFNNQWHLNNTAQGGGLANADINAPEAWELTRGNGNVLIAVIDDAIDTRHEDLAANVVRQRDITSDPDDDDAGPTNSVESHGTSAAGVAMAKGGNRIGVTGSCPECKMIAIRALGGPYSNQARAFDYAVESGAWVISNSWGYVRQSPVTDDVVDAINNAAANGRNGLGCVILFAVSNEYYDNCAGSQIDISSLPSVIAVGSSTNQDKYARSGFGDCLDVIAPTRGGTLGVVTTDITGNDGYANNNYYTNFGGTSSATPLVAGVVGLMLTVKPSLTKDQVREILISTAEKIDKANAKYNNAGFSKTHGYGRVNALAAVLKAKK